MIPLLTALANALTQACQAYVAFVTWTQTTHLEDTIHELDLEKIRLGDSSSPADGLRLEAVAARLKRLRAQPQRPL